MDTTTAHVSAVGETPDESSVFTFNTEAVRKPVPQLGHGQQPPVATRERVLSVIAQQWLCSSSRYGFRPSDFKLQPAPTGRQIRRRRQERANEAAREAFLLTYDGAAQPQPRDYGAWDLVSDTPPAEQQPAPLPLAAPSVCQSPDLFCAETLASPSPHALDMPESLSALLRAPIVERQDVEGEAPTATDVAEYRARSTNGKWGSDEVIVISDDDEAPDDKKAPPTTTAALLPLDADISDGEADCMIVAQYEEKERRKARVRGAHIAIERARRRQATREGALFALRANLARSKANYEAAKFECARLEESIRVKREACEAFDACLAATASSTSTRTRGNNKATAASYQRQQSDSVSSTFKW